MESRKGAIPAPNLIPGLCAIWILLCLVGPGSGQSENPELKYQVEEEKPRGSYVGAVVTDANLETWFTHEQMAQLEFMFLRQGQEYFSVEQDTGVIKTAQKLNRDEICPGQELCEVRIDVAILPVELYRTIKITATILDVNDNAPVFPEMSLSYEMRESAMAGRDSFIVPSAYDPDSPQYSIKYYELFEAGTQFKLTERKKYDGSIELKILLKESLDREHTENYELKLVAFDGGNPPQSGTLLIHVNVLDANDNSPEFEQEKYEVTINENVKLHTTVLQVHAEDRDAGANGQVVYSFSPHTQFNYGNVFAINNVTGDIYVKGVIDYEEVQVYNLMVTAWDQGADSIPGETVVILHVRDVNDHAPEISVNTLTSTEPGVARVQEDAPVNTFVAHVTVVDKDTGANAEFNCSLNDSHFELRNNGDGEFEVLTAVILDREEKSQYNLVLLCRDRGSEPKTSTENIQVNVLDVNDHAPVFRSPSYQAELIENSYIGVIVLRVNATDEDTGKNGQIEYDIPGEAGLYFEVDSQTGDLKARAMLDREAQPEHRFHIIARDQGKPAMSSSVLVVVTILDVNDEKPMFTQDTYSFAVFENEPVGTSIGMVSAYDKDSAIYSQFTYSIVPSHMSTLFFGIDRETGVITNLKVLDREALSKYYLTVRASDRGVPPLTSQTEVIINVGDQNDNPPVFSYPALENNTIYLSNKAATNHLVTRIKAHDLDAGQNAIISFRLTGKGKAREVFQLDEDTGAITVRKGISHIENELFHLTIEAVDKGVPPLRATANLNIIVNKSVALPYDAQEASVLSGHNLVIVIALACVSGIITIILVVAIIIIRRQDRRKPTAKYNCRMEALKMLAAKEAGIKTSDRDSDSSDYNLGNGGTVPNGKVLPSSGLGTVERQRKEVSFSVDVEDDGIDLSSPVQEKNNHSWPSTLDNTSLQHPQAHSSIIAGNLNTPPGGGMMNQAHGPRHNLHPHPNGTKPWANHHMSQKEMEVHQLLQLLKRDQDASSIHSGEGSATDSGRGPSEEGETAYPGQRSNETAVTRSPGHSPVHTTAPVAKENSCHSDHSLSNQVVPDPSINTTTGSSHSYSSNKPRVLQTFTSPYSKPQYGSGYDGLRGSSPRVDTVLNISTDSVGLEKGFMNTTPTKVLALEADSRYGNHKLNRTPPKPGCPGNLHGYHSNGEEEDYEETESEFPDNGPAIQYSCADMTDIHTKSISLHSNSILEDDAATTTSGSYTVDPQDLCDEIDELFFKDMGL